MNYEYDDIFTDDCYDFLFDDYEFEEETIELLAAEPPRDYVVETIELEEICY